jgi:hypothetical protein
LKYHPFLVSREIKPASTIAQIPDVGEDEEDEVEQTPDPEVINHGEDKATLALVAKLSEDPVRSLRKRPASTSSAPDSMERRQRTRSSASGVLNTPRRSTRAVVESPLHTMAVGEDADGVWEVDEDVDAEGEEYEEE